MINFNKIGRVLIAGGLVVSCIFICVTGYEFIKYSKNVEVELHTRSEISDLTYTLNDTQSIQDILDLLNANNGGGTIILQEGTWVINESLLIGSNICLRGMGKKSVITNNGTSNFPLIKNLNEMIRNILITKILINGTLKDDEMHYPPEHHTEDETYDHIGRKSVLGILFAAFNQNTMENIIIKDVSITRCAMGIHIKGARGITVSNCHLYDNGAIEKYFHNFYIRRVQEAHIVRNNLSNSPTGNGLNVDICNLVYCLDNVANDNYWRGLRFDNSNNTFVERNIANNNGDVGIRIVNIINGTLKENTALDNGWLTDEILDLLSSENNENFIVWKNTYGVAKGLPKKFSIYWSFLPLTIVLFGIMIQIISNINKA